MLQWNQVKNELGHVGQATEQDRDRCSPSDPSLQFKSEAVITFDIDTLPDPKVH